MNPGGGDDGTEVSGLAVSAFWQGVRDGVPFLLVLVPFGLVFGVAATEAGLNLAEVMGFSVLVIAGAAQFVALQMMIDNAPVLIVLAASLAVNLRMAMYSAALAPHLGQVAWWKRAVAAYVLTDQSFAVSTLRFDNTPGMSRGTKLAYYFGTAAPVCLPWYVATWAGAVLGASVPPGLPIDFAVPITFLALIMPMLRSAPHVVAAGVSVSAALGFAGMPYNTGLLVAAALAMVSGAAVEAWLQRRRAEIGGDG